MSTGGQGHAHSFDRISGWCGFCNLRDDGKLISKTGDVLRPGPDYTFEQLQVFRDRASA